MAPREESHMAEKCEVCGKVKRMEGGGVERAQDGSRNTYPGKRMCPDPTCPGRETSLAEGS
jgi:hypothetical protein